MPTFGCASATATSSARQFGNSQSSAPTIFAYIASAEMDANAWLWFCTTFRNSAGYGQQGIASGPGGTLWITDDKGVVVFTPPKA